MTPLTLQDTERYKTGVKQQKLPKYKTRLTSFDPSFELRIFKRIFKVSAKKQRSYWLGERAEIYTNAAIGWLIERARKTFAKYIYRVTIFFAIYTFEQIYI